jgi:antitoxin component YwqK of YwqJK toxin-antitoxin module
MNQCIGVTDSVGYSIYYYSNGLVKSFEPMMGKSIHGQKIDYFENGSIYTTTQYENGRANGEIRIYYPSGNLKAINLIQNDSIYYARFFKDSILSGNYTEELIPIVFLEPDTLPLNDTIEIKIQFPLVRELGLEPGEFILRYDKLPAKLLEGKNPYAKYAVDLMGSDIWIGVGAGIESFDKFYCYITDNNGKIIGPTIYRDLYFVNR